MEVNIHQAKTQLSKLVDRALAGEDVIIARNGEPLLRLVPLERPAVERTPGLSSGKAVVTPDFDEPIPPDILEEFEK